VTAIKKQCLATVRMSGWSALLPRFPPGYDADKDIGCWILTIITFADFENDT